MPYFKKACFSTASTSNITDVPKHIDKLWKKYCNAAIFDSQRACGISHHTLIFFTPKKRCEMKREIERYKLDEWGANGKGKMKQYYTTPFTCINHSMGRDLNFMYFPMLQCNKSRLVCNRTVHWRNRKKQETFFCPALQLSNDGDPIIRNTQFQCWKCYLLAM